MSYLKRRMKHWQIIMLILIVYDLITIFVSYFAALLLRFDFRYSEIPEKYLHIFLYSIPVYVLVTLLIYYFGRLYKSIWQFASYHELIRIGSAVALSSVSYVIVTIAAGFRMPISYYLFGMIAQGFFAVFVRFSYRFVLLLRGTRDPKVKELTNVMIIGAGHTGGVIAREVKSAIELNEKVVCFIDDNSNKWGRMIDGVTCVGGSDRIVEAAEKYQVEKIYLSIPSASPKDKREVIEICNRTGCTLMNLPGVFQLGTGQVSVSQMKPVAIEDLLGRDPIRTDMSEVFSFIEGKTVMVTGGGGSIGSELCRQIAAHGPRQLIILDIYENSVYEVQQELRRTHPDLDLQVIIASIRDSRKLFEVFARFRPEVVYHAAAHKHVPLMEDNPCESIKNNALGTYKTAYAAMAHGCKRFVLISTDKAVNPTNIMGASKRLCEMIVQAFDAKIKEGKAAKIPQLFTHGVQDLIEKPELVEALRNTKTEFVAVRFGNVLGSNGSVIPLFKKQIEQGGPVTVTHPEIIRYFMTIPEAVSLVLLAGTNAKGGEIFVLDMGEPVKIVELARNLIRLSGYKPDEEIKITFTGLRPGEKLYEEKLMSEEGMKKTKNDLIHIGCPIPFDIEDFMKALDHLMEQAYKNDENIRDEVAKVVTTYRVEEK